MAINFPTAPANDTIFPAQPTQVAYRYKSAAPAYWRDMRGRASRTNRFIDPAFQISQVNNPFADGINIAGLYISDVWLSHCGITGSVRQQRVVSPTPKGGNHRFRATVNTADTTPVANEWFGLNTRMEGVHMADLLWGTANAVPIIVRFGWRSPAGTYTLGIRNHVPDRSYLFPFTISAGQANTDTEQIVNIPGDVAGTWKTDNSLHSYWYWSIMNVNTTSSGNINKWFAGNALAASGNQSNGLATVGNVFEIFDMGCYADPNRTGIAPDYEVPDPALELLKVQRYVQRCFGLRGIIGTATVADRMGSTLAVPMRTVPALSVYGGPGIYDGNVSPPVTSITANYSSRSFIDCQCTCSAGGFNLYRPALMYYYSNGEWDYILAKAEL